MLQLNTRFQIGQCQVDFGSGEFRRADQVSQIDARLAKLLMYLVHRPGTVVSSDELLEQVWEGVVVSQDSVYQAVTALRRVFDDDPKKPGYILTVPRRGYKLIAPVRHLDMMSEPLADTARPAIVARTSGAVDGIRWRPQWLLLVCLLVAAAGWAAYVGVSRMQSASAVKPWPVARSLVVLPFLDLTDSMSEEPFADGMVEELISRLSKLPGATVAPASDSFFYKDKDVKLADIARALHVDYALEGSVRKSGDTLRVAVRLTRVADHVVVWSENYDRPWRDKLQIQDDIATAVSRSLAHSS